MEGDRKVIAKNIILCRKSANLTQAELAEKLNYSDKAVSKWERGEAIPDVFVLKQIADLFNVTVDYMLKDHIENNIVLPEKKVDLKRRRNLIVTLSSSLVWLIATIVFAVLLMLPFKIEKAWLAFIWALPATGIIHIVFSCLWYSNLRRGITISLFIWLSFVAICLTVPYPKIWLLLLIAIPMQIIVVLWFVYVFIRSKAIKKEKENLISVEISNTKKH